MRGICFISYYFEGVIYAILQDASDDVPLLDVAFPNINGKGNGLTLQIYEEGERENKDSISWRKLSIWELTGEEETLMDEEVESTFSLSSPSYIQSYAVLKPNFSNVEASTDQPRHYHGKDHRLTRIENGKCFGLKETLCSFLI
uniref:Uncharacterized protein n=1 Tax=Chaetoceros debilis TaxID=122233 RepID=A0A7S3Q941_9STRA|eukprot:CAMPEP_0194107494 /NCGR_PEP_ID=MMETSP0150-20130528/7366_1 /TAXON_ID=122233 /ORGANISM="Chaetoceros debilis, Strain MM31A-1" /LENGTH=143 /DNA_ID=CAMNT_0038795917 /DNA_START=260 /DNA_END=691 /DNA_ORIENTATION=-